MCLRITYILFFSSFDLSKSDIYVVFIVFILSITREGSCDGSMSMERIQKIYAVASSVVEVAVFVACGLGLILAAIRLS